MGVFFFDRVGVVPEVEVVHVAVVEPEADVVRVIYTLACTRLEWKAACYDGAVGCAERIEDGLREVVGPDVGGEGLAVDHDVDAARGFVGENLDSRRGRAVLLGEGETED